MQEKRIWLPLLASIGVGAATFYSMSKNDQDIGQIMQQFMPGKSASTNMNSSDGNDSEMLGPYGMS